MSTIILTWNPSRWQWTPAQRAQDIVTTRDGYMAPGRWSVGNRRGGIAPGRDRAFLLRQGSEPRGIVASGVFSSDAFEDEHWDDDRADETAWYAEVLWDHVVDDQDVLPMADLQAHVQGVNWSFIPSSGNQLPTPGDQQLAQRWAQHLATLLDHDGTSRPDDRGHEHHDEDDGQGYQTDPARRQAVEKHAQAMLERYYRTQGWTVTDTHLTKPYDAIAIRGSEVLYLEAKGTEGRGKKVTVTEGEVAHARAHPGRCILGIVSGIRFHPNGTVDATSGTLTRHDWVPDAGVLTPRSHYWVPPES